MRISQKLTGLIENPIFVDGENISHQNDGYEDDYMSDYNRYKTSNTNIKETAFRTTSSINKKLASTLRLRQKGKRQKLASLLRYLNVTNDLDMIDID